MTIDETIHLLTKLKEKYEDVEVITDCNFCGKETKPTAIVVSPIKVRLKE